MSVRHVLKRKLQIRVHRTWSTDHNSIETKQSKTGVIIIIILKSCYFLWISSKPLHSVGQTFAAFEAFPLFVLLCWRVGAWYKISLPEHQFSLSTQHVLRDVMKMSTSQPGLSQRPRKDHKRETHTKHKNDALGAEARWWIWITYYIWIEENASHVSPLCHEVRLHCSDGSLHRIQIIFPKGISTSRSQLSIATGI